MKIEVKKHFWHILSVFLLVVVGVLGYFNIGLSRRVDALRVQLDGYKEKEGRSYVVERISKQMEDIAYQQKDISEKQREEAVFQMGVAEQMRIRAEEERKRRRRSPAMRLKPEIWRRASVSLPYNNNFVPNTQGRWLIR